eukprot:TRINITY_DN2966_c0_g1_i2.p1 TRINITY_DN2966_c0_g1~~TRINITY_DN2966_c0_g1_i2.p1  ORF type:complete len:892 (-),score=72.49 TRINITY_DN2966_c0_g1_i2:92-2767(-)
MMKAGRCYTKGNGKEASFSEETITVTDLSSTTYEGDKTTVKITNKRNTCTKRQLGMNSSATTYDPEIMHSSSDYANSYKATSRSEISTGKSKMVDPEVKYKSFLTKPGGVKVSLLVLPLKGEPVIEKWKSRLISFTSSETAQELTEQIKVIVEKGFCEPKPYLVQEEMRLWILSPYNDSNQANELLNHPEAIFKIAKPLDCTQSSFRPTPNTLLIVERTPITALSTKFNKIGLHNIGNTCFMNAGLQCLYRTPSLTTYFRQISYQSLAKLVKGKGCIGKAKDSLAMEYKRLIDSLDKCKGSAYKPEDFYNILANWMPDYKKGAQYDTFLFVMDLLDQLHDELKQNKNEKVAAEEAKHSRCVPQKVSEEKWKRYVEMERTVVLDEFHGQVSECKKCRNCSNYSTTPERFSALNLPIPTKGFVKITFCFVPDPIINISVEFRNVKVDLDDCIKDLRKEVADVLNCEEDSFTLAMMSDGQFDLLLNDQDRIDRIIEMNKKYRSQLFVFQIIQDAYKGYKKVANRRITSVLCKEILQVKLLIMSASCVPTKSGETLKVYKRETFDRIIHINKTWTLKELHMKVFECLKYLFNSFKINFGKGVVANTHSSVFQDYFKELTSENWNEFLSFPTRIPYVVQIINYTDYSMPNPPSCRFCHSRNCTDCPLPFTDETVGSFLSKARIGATTNSYHYADHSSYADGNNDFELKVVFSDDPNIAKADLRPLKVQSDISQEIRVCDPKNDLTLEDCFFLYSCEEVLKGDNAYNCKYCGKVTAKKRSDLSILPSTLILQLKRSAILPDCLFLAKLNNFVSFQSNIKLRSLCDPAPKKYSLYAVCNHQGKLNAGHYYAFVKDSNDGKWSCYNDSNVTGIDESAIFSEHAYVLFYKSCEQRHGTIS